MARCPECGRRAAFGAGRSVLPALSGINQILSDLREEKAGGDTSAAAMISEGERYQADLHTVAHNMNALYINWPAIQGWIDRATQRQREKIRKMQNP